MAVKDEPLKKDTEKQIRMWGLQKNVESQLNIQDCKYRGVEKDELRNSTVTWDTRERTKPIWQSSNNSLSALETLGELEKNLGRREKRPSMLELVSVVLSKRERAF